MIFLLPFEKWLINDYCNGQSIYVEFIRLFQILSNKRYFIHHYMIEDDKIKHLTSITNKRLKTSYLTFFQWFPIKTALFSTVKHKNTFFFDVMPFQ